MGSDFSVSDNDNCEDSGRRTSSHPVKTAPKLNISRTLDGLSNTIDKWQTIIANLRKKQMPDEEAQLYLYQEVMETRNNLNKIIDCLLPTFVSYTQSSETIEASSQKQNEQVPGKPKIRRSPGIPTLERDVDKYKERSEMYKRVNDELFVKYADLEAQSIRINQEKDEIFLRLSQVTSDKLTANNPNITNLGDPNRPSKLGEMISELYDNEWTDALEGLQTQGRNERNAIWVLFETLMVLLP